MTIQPDYTPDSADFYAAWEESLDSFAPDWRDMTDETLALASEEADQRRDEDTPEDTLPHAFFGIDGRCFHCDIRPHTAARTGAACVR